jgi:hypothetical protein
MAERLLFTAAGMLSLSLAVAPMPVDAADPAFCRQYARAALVQVRTALASEHCGAGLQGTRWSAEFPVHYEWCLGASPDATAAEREARMRYLRRCADQ